MSEVTIQLNGKPVTCKMGQKILEVCAQNGSPVPSICYDKELGCGGTCLSCLVGVEHKGEESNQPACQVEAVEGLSIWTDEKTVQAARDANLDLLLSRHPLECFTCQKGGACVLQDAVLTQKSCSEFLSTLPKKKDEGEQTTSLISIQPHKCILCEKCVVFGQTFLGPEVIRLSGKGCRTSIHIEQEAVVRAGVIGHLADLCPAGVFKYTGILSPTHGGRLRRVPSLDITDSFQRPVHILEKGNQIVHIQPTFFSGGVQGYLSDKGRLIHTGISAHRIESPYLRQKGELVQSGWVDVFKAAVKALTAVAPSEIGVIAGGLVDFETFHLMKELLDSMGVMHRDSRKEETFYCREGRGNYLFNTPMDRIVQADVCLIVGANPGREAPGVNLALQRAVHQGTMQLGWIGQADRFSAMGTILSESASVLEAILSGQHPFSKALSDAKFPLIIVGESVLSSVDGEKVYALIQQMAKKFKCVRSDWNGLNVLHRQTNQVAALDVGFLPGEKGLGTQKILKEARMGKIKVLYLLGADEIDLPVLRETKVIYQGSYWHAASRKADIVFPSAVYAEKRACYVNAAGKAQKTMRAIHCGEVVKEDWKIIRALSEVIGHKLPYTVWEDVLHSLKKTYPKAFAESSPLENEVDLDTLPVGSLKFGSVKKNSSAFYTNTIIARASALLNRAEAFVQKNGKEKKRYHD